MDIKSMLSNPAPVTSGQTSNSAPVAPAAVRTVDSEAVRGRSKSGALGIKNTGAVLLEANKDAATLAAEITAGNLLNARVAKLVAPKLPMMVRGYADTTIGRAALSNLVAGAVINFMPNNQMAVRAADAMVKSAMLTLVGEFNIEEMMNDLLDGITLPEATSKKASTRRAAAAE
jgi:hypothetical protein